ncbi:MAG: rhodanese-like domain-containing protein [Geminicoccaceae bacterium]
MARVLVLAGTLVLVGAGSVVLADGQDQHVPEPAGFWSGPFMGPVPATIAGGTVLDTAALRTLVERGGVLLVDTGPAPRRPPTLGPNQPWLPLAHADIPGSVWLPDLGLPVLPEPANAWFRQRLEQLTAGDPARTVVTYCHPSCWASWNAAKRLIGYGYRDVRWYPGGIEAWQEAGLPTASAKPETPPE